MFWTLFDMWQNSNFNASKQIFSLKHITMKCKYILKNALEMSLRRDWVWDQEGTKDQEA